MEWINVHWVSIEPLLLLGCCLTAGAKVGSDITKCSDVYEAKPDDELHADLTSPLWGNPIFLMAACGLSLLLGAVITLISLTS